MPFKEAAAAVAACVALLALAAPIDVEYSCGLLKRDWKGDNDCLFRLLASSTRARRREEEEDEGGGKKAFGGVVGADGREIVSVRRKSRRRTLLLKSTLGKVFKCIAFFNKILFH